LIELHKYCRWAGGAHVGSGQSMANELLLSCEHVAGKSKLPVSGLDSDMLFRWNLYTPHCLWPSRALHSNLRRVYFVLTICLHTFESKILIPCVRCHRAPLWGEEKRHREGEAERKLLFSIQKSPSRWLCDAQRARIFKDSLEDGLLPLPLPAHGFLT
jgi:hypothetical protein